MTNRLTCVLLMALLGACDGAKTEQPAQPASIAPQPAAPSAPAPAPDRPSDPVEFAKAYTAAIAAGRAEEVIRDWYDWQEVARRTFGAEFENLGRDDRQKTSEQMRDLVLFPYIDPTLAESFRTAEYSAFESQVIRNDFVATYTVRLTKPVEFRASHALHLRLGADGRMCIVDADNGRGATMSQALGAAYTALRSDGKGTPVSFMQTFHDMAKKRLESARAAAPQTPGGK